MTRIKDGFENAYVQEVFAEVLDSLDFSAKIEQAIYETEKELSAKEAELREWAQGECTELGDEISQVRMIVEQGR